VKSPGSIFQSRGRSASCYYQLSDGYRFGKIAIDTRGSSSSISTLAGLTQQRRQVGQSGRSGGGDIGRVVRSVKLLCTKVVEIIKNLEQECQGSASLLINQRALVFDSDEKNFSQTALKLKGLCEEAVQKFGSLEGNLSVTWNRNLYLLKDTLRAKKLQFGEVGYMKVAEVHNTKHTITMLVDKFLHFQGEIETSRNKRIELLLTIADNNKSSRPLLHTQGSTGDRVTEVGKFDEATVTSEGVAKKTKVD